MFPFSEPTLSLAKLKGGHKARHLEQNGHESLLATAFLHRRWGRHHRESWPKLPVRERESFPVSASSAGGRKRWGRRVCPSTDKALGPAPNLPQDFDLFGPDSRVFGTALYPDCNVIRGLLEIKAPQGVLALWLLYSTQGPNRLIDRSELPSFWAHCVYSLWHATHSVLVRAKFAVVVFRFCVLALRFDIANFDLGQKGLCLWNSKHFIIFFFSYK